MSGWREGSWEAGCAAALDEIGSGSMSDRYTLPWLSVDFDWLQDHADDAPRRGWRWVGRGARKLLGDLHDEDASMVTFLAAKQANYGHNNINAYGKLGLRVRCSDKLARARNMYDKGLTRDESVEPYADCFRDIYGYAVIALMLLDGTFDNPLEADMEPEVVEGSTDDGRREFLLCPSRNGIYLDEDPVAFVVGADGVLRVKR